MTTKKPPTTKKNTDSKKKSKTAGSKKNSSNKREEYKVDGKKLLEKVKELLEEGNARRIIIKNEKGETLIEMPLTVGVVGSAAGVVFAPFLAAVGALTALVAKCSIIVEKK